MSGVEITEPLHESGAPPVDSNGRPIDLDKYPSSVYFIVGSEAVERFSFYGLRAILALYLTDFLLMSEDVATTVVHTFVFTSYAMALVGGWISDTKLGKFKTILYFSVIYTFGTICQAVTAIPGITGYPPQPWGVAISLFLIAIGTGGIKPCVSAFVGDQFVPGQEKLLVQVFSVFYFAINLGSLLSTFITPMVHQYYAFWIAFSLPAALMILATFVVWLGRRR
eukprot:TRINITY_DN11451_c0_g1_i1.p1 TRINITY_DN11451_c0_g1~~TRINITY_DN11451_c0_g1_i1.p1  ORF type:complete len:224 (-),score=29.90 TRINITY_DN11451_c0_g1_i1:10-681(-)